MDNSLFISTDNGSAVPVEKVPVLETGEFRAALIEAVKYKKREILSFFAMPEGEKFKLVVILGNAPAHKFEILNALFYVEKLAFRPMRQYSLLQRKILTKLFPVYVDLPP